MRNTSTPGFYESSLSTFGFIAGGVAAYCLRKFPVYYPLTSLVVSTVAGIAIGRKLDNMVWKDIGSKVSNDCADVQKPRRFTPLDN